MAPLQETTVPMKHKVPHHLGRENARKVAEAAWETYSKRFAEFNPTLTWTSESRGEIGFRAKGITLSGALEVLDDSIDLELEVPFLLRPFKGKAIAIIEEETQAWIRKSEDGEL